jgi:hypothetical protein
MQQDGDDRYLSPILRGSVGLCSVVLLWPMDLSVYLCVYSRERKESSGFFHSFLLNGSKSFIF